MSTTSIPGNDKHVWFDALNIGLKVHSGIYENMEADGLRWYDHSGRILYSGQESTSMKRKRAEAKKNAQRHKKRL